MWATVYGLTGVKHDLVTKPPRSQRASLVAQMVKNLLVVLETWVRSMSQEDPLEKEMATHSSILG